MGYEHQENALGCGESRQWQTHTHSVPCDTQGGWILGQGSDGILTHESVARPPIKSMVYEHREYIVGVGGSRQYQTHTHTHTHTHTVSLVIHRVDGASGKDRTQS